MGGNHRPKAAGLCEPICKDQLGRDDIDYSGRSLVEVVRQSNAYADVHGKADSAGILECRNYVSANEYFLEYGIQNRNGENRHKAQARLYELIGIAQRPRSDSGGCQGYTLQTEKGRPISFR